MFMISVGGAENQYFPAEEAPARCSRAKYNPVSYKLSIIYQPR